MLRSEIILQSISDGLFTLDREWRFTYLNPQAERYLEKRSEELLGKNIWEQYPLAAESPFYACYHQAVEKQQKVSFESYAPTLRGWYDVTVYPSADGISVYFRDISSTKEVQEAFQEQIRLSKLIAEVSQGLTMNNTLPEMLKCCTEALVKNLKVAFARIWTLNSLENVLELQASSGEYTYRDGGHSRVPVGSFKIGWIARERQPHLTNSVKGDKLIADQQWAERENMIAFAGYPLLLEDRLLGVVAIFSHTAISETTYEALGTLVKQIALGIDRKKNESSLREQRENYKVTLSSIGDAVIATDNHGLVTYLNSVAEDLTGWKAADALGQPLQAIFNIVNMLTREPVENPVSKVLQLGQVVGLANHTVLLSCDGREIPIDDSAAPIKNNAGQVIGVVLVFRDATERLNSEAERQQLFLREQSARQEAEEARTRLYNLFMQAPANIAILDGPDHVYTFANTPFLRMIGHGVEIMNKPIAEAEPEVAGQGYFELLDQVYQTGQPYIGHEASVLLPREGTNELVEVFLDFVYQPFKNVAGQIAGILVHAVDVTEHVLNRRRIEALLDQLADQQAQLKASNEHLRFLSEASATLSSSLDYNTTLKRVAELLVPSLADFCYFDIMNSDGNFERVAWQSIDTTHEDLFKQLATFAPSLQRANHPVTEVVFSGQPKLVPYVTDEWLRQATYNEEHFELARQIGLCSYLAVPLKLRDTVFGTITLCYTMGSGRHYSEAEQDLALELTQRAAMAIDNSRLYYATQKGLKERETFLSVAAHELKTPLTGLKGFTQVLNRYLERDEKNALDPTRIKRTLDIINKQSDKLNYLIDQLLDVSRIETGKLQLDLRETEVVSLVRELVEQAQSRTNLHNLTFNANEENLLARIDPMRYEQVVNTLLDNAIKYSPEGGPITVDLRRVDAAFRLSVSDRGLGIPVERRPYIFEQFYQAHETTLINGMGLGLFICREIIQLHSGEIHAEFPAESGTTFVVTVPLNH